MIDPPKATTLTRDDYPSEAAWIDKLLRPLNAFISGAAAFLAGSLEAQGKIQFFDDVFTTDGTLANSFPRYFAVPRLPRSVSIAQIEEIATGATLATAAFPTWTAANEQAGLRVKIRHITGLSTSTKYRVRFEVVF